MWFLSLPSIPIDSAASHSMVRPSICKAQSTKGSRPATTLLPPRSHKQGTRSSEMVRLGQPNTTRSQQMRSSKECQLKVTPNRRFPRLGRGSTQPPMVNTQQDRDGCAQLQGNAQTINSCQGENGSSRQTY
jgi:hypothetical protein